MSSTAALDPHEVASREDLAWSIAALREDFLAHGETWENQSLDRYLDAMAAWLHATSRWDANMHGVAPELVSDVENPSQRLMARITRRTQL